MAATSVSRQSNYGLHKGDVVRIETAIGGGYGDPLERDPALVAVDVLDGYLARDAAKDVYGVVLTADGAVDESATGQARERLAESRDAVAGPSTRRRRATFVPDADGGR